LIRTLDEFQVQIGTFQHILEGYKVADSMAHHGAMASAFADWWAYKLEVADAIPYAGAMMHNQGVVVSFNSDDGELGRRMNHEAAKAVKYGGVEPAEALKFVTLNPAKQLRVDQYVGSLEVGKHADLVVWSGSPLSTLSRVDETWIDGVKYFDRPADEAWRHELEGWRQSLIQKILDSGSKMAEPGQDIDPDNSRDWPRFDEYCRAKGE
jgi:N-acetylglucosamine-6-phosphate deacetylase